MSEETDNLLRNLIEEIRFGNRTLLEISGKASLIMASLSDLNTALSTLAATATQVEAALATDVTPVDYTPQITQLGAINTALQAALAPATPATPPAPAAT